MTLLRRFLALVVAIALAAAAALVIVEAVAIWFGRSSVLLPVDDWEQRLTTGEWRRWSAEAWTIASLSALAAGVLLILVQVIPDRTTTLDRRRHHGEREVRFGRRGLGERLRAIVADQDGVLGGTVQVSRRKVDVQARIPKGGDRTATEQQVRIAVREELGRLRLASKPRVAVGAVHIEDRVL